MFHKTIIILSLFFSSYAFGAGYDFDKSKNVSNAPKASATYGETFKVESGDTLALDDNNSIILRGVITYSSVAPVIKKLVELSSKLPTNSVIYLFLDTPGGSIDAGEELIQVARSIPQEVKTITLFAASMGFITVQSLGERLVLSNGTLMSHRASMRLSGQVPGEFDTKYEFHKKDIKAINNRMAERLGMSYEEYSQLIRDEYWVKGLDALEAKMVDKHVNVVCGKESLGTYEQKVKSLFGTFTVVWSKCPLVSAPLEVKSGVFYESGTHNQVMEILTGSKNRVFEKYIKTGKYKEILH